ncbi:MAG TPA: 4-hydroxy-tetrahydrodipicolinate synthase, partial [Saprospiraceae bacterium]|nr:4-hydroxy-tetrahydrodipicolinate synthase [Saprospiraceae bacterium]
KIAHFDFTGFDALMSSSPSYNKPSQEGIFQHYMKVAEVSPLPIIIYNVPSRTASNVTAATILRLAHASEKFLAVKEAAGDMVQAMQIIKNKPEHFQLLSGDDPLTLPLISCGAEGVISVIGNAFPHTFSSMVRAALDEDFVAARQLNDILLDVHPWLYVDGNPSGVKAAMEILGLCSKEVRLPLAPATDKTISELKIEIEKVLVAQTVN